jgi:hypothetical protein
MRITVPTISIEMVIFHEFVMNLPFDRVFQRFSSVSRDPDDGIA